MNQSVFDPDTFMNQQIEGKLETHFTPVPEDDYTGLIDDLAFGEITNSQTGQKQRVLNISWALLDEKAQKAMERDKPLVQQTVFLDFEKNGSLSTGKNKNIMLGQIREAVGQNSGAAWSFGMLRGAGPALLKITHQASKDDPEMKYPRVKRVAKLLSK